MNYVEFFEVEIPNWMRQSNQVMARVGFATDDYWRWVVQSMGALCKKYSDDELVRGQCSLIFEWLEGKAKEMV